MQLLRRKEGVNLVYRCAKQHSEPATAGESVSGVVPLGNAVPTRPEPVPPKCLPAHYLWAVLIARIYEVFPLLWEHCDAQMGEGVEAQPDWDLAEQPAPDYEVDQRVNW